MAGIQCDGQMSADILNDCTDSVLGGIEVNVLIINDDEIKRQSTVFNATNPLLMTGFALKTAKVGYLLEGVKQVNVLKDSLVQKERTSNKYKHTFEFVILQPTVANRNTLHKMNGGKFVVIVEQKYKGKTLTEAFAVGGYDAGMEIQTSEWSTNENDGNIAVTMTSVDGNEEPKPHLTLLITDYAATKTLFDNKFIGL